MFLGLGGSYAYGTYREESDIDFRGVTLQLPSDLIGLTEFEQYEDDKTDTVIKPQIPAIRDFIQSEIVRQKNAAYSLADDRNRDWTALNRVFMEIFHGRNLYICKETKYWKG